jgi:hypothetical protein
MRRLARRVLVVSYLNQINRLASELEDSVTQTGDWILLSDDASPNEVIACLAKASECALKARQTLEALEEHIRSGEWFTKRNLGVDE